MYRGNLSRLASLTLTSQSGQHGFYRKHRHGTNDVARVQVTGLPPEKNNGHLKVEKPGGAAPMVNGRGGWDKYD